MIILLDNQNIFQIIGYDDAWNELSQSKNPISPRYRLYFYI